MEMTGGVGDFASAGHRGAYVRLSLTQRVFILNDEQRYKTTDYRQFGI